MSGRARRYGAVAALALVGTASRAVASPGSSASSSERLTYEAPEACPKREALVREIEERAIAPWPVSLHVDVVIERAEPSGYAGRAVVERHGVRTLHAARCELLVQALGLAIATAAGEDQAEEPAAPPVEPRTAAAPEPADRPSAAPVTRGVASEPSLGVAVGATGGVGSGPAPELAVFGGLVVGRVGLRLSVAASRSGDVATSIGSARFERGVGRLEACFPELRAGALGLAPCGAFEAGLLAGSGGSIPNAASDTHLWLAAGLGPRATAYLSTALFVDLEARATFPLLRHTFYVRPSEDVYRVPALAAGAFVAVGYRFSK